MSLRARKKGDPGKPHLGGFLTEDYLIIISQKYKNIFDRWIIRVGAVFLLSQEPKIVQNKGALTK